MNDIQLWMVDNGNDIQWQITYNAIQCCHICEWLMMVMMIVNDIQWWMMDNGDKNGEWQRMVNDG